MTDKVKCMTKEETNNKLEITKNKIESSWFIADKWFRILEFSLILAVFRYFESTANNIALTTTYWLSWAFLWSWFEDFSKYIIEIVIIKNKFAKAYRILAWMLSIVFVATIYLLVTIASDSVVNKQYL